MALVKDVQAKVLSIDDGNYKVSIDNTEHSLKLSDVVSKFHKNGLTVDKEYVISYDNETNTITYAKKFESKDQGAQALDLLRRIKSDIDKLL